MKLFSNFTSSFLTAFMASSLVYVVLNFGGIIYNIPIVAWTLGLVFLVPSVIFAAILHLNRPAFIKSTILCVVFLIAAYGFLFLMTDSEGMLGVIIYGGRMAFWTVIFAVIAKVIKKRRTQVAAIAQDGSIR